MHEIEHRYLLSGLPKEEKLQRRSHSVVKSKHIYLPGDVIQERFSKRLYYKDLKKAVGQVCYKRTVKIGHGIDRLEFKENTHREVYHYVKNMFGVRKLKKIRYRVQDSDVVWEVDRFLDRDLFLAEVEVPNVDYHAPIPEWLEPYIIREVTEELPYEGVALAR